MLLAVTGNDLRHKLFALIRAEVNLALTRFT